MGKYMKKSCKNNKFKISRPTWNYKFELLDGEYSLSDFQDYFQYIVKKHETVTDNPPLRIYGNNIENRITFKIINGYYLKLLTHETIKLLGSNKNKITKDGNGENTESINPL